MSVQPFDLGLGGTRLICRTLPGTGRERAVWRFDQVDFPPHTALRDEWQTQR